MIFLWAAISALQPLISNGKHPTVSITFPSDIADVDFQNSSLAIISNSYPVFDLNCNASYPIEWIPFYEEDDDGTSEEKKLAETHRFVTDFNDPATYIYSAILSLAYTGKLQVFTNFSCRSVINSDLQTNVIITAKERKKIMFMNITSEQIYTRNEPIAAQNSSCPVYASVSDINKTASCWRCERANGTELELDFIGCKSAIQCNSNYQRYNRGKECLRILAKRIEDEICKKIGVADYNPKTLVCKDFGPVLSQFYYFGISQTNEPPPMYFDWTEMDPQKMMYFHPIKEELYYGQTIEVTCEMSKYYFSLGSWFGFLTNGTILYEQRDETLEDAKGTFTSTINLTLADPGLTKIFCFAPIWNSTQWVNSSRELHIKNGEIPHVISVVSDAVSEDFIIGRRNRSLLCTFKGKPAPQVEWEGPSGGYFHIETDTRESFSKLIFPEVTFASNGDYRCIVHSFLGSDTKSFTVKAIQESSSKLIKSTVSIAGILVAVFAIAVGFIVIRLWQIIKRQREALRLLTETEIKEFVEGNPAFVSQNEYFDKNFVIEALPYDKKYELSPNDLHIDYNNLLGKGSFGKVYGGRVQLVNNLHYIQVKKTNRVQDNFKDSLEVAIKTCDTNVDVLFFKALLSEIKIMAHIGYNKNIVSLVGACTQNIRKREVFIAVEYCPNGCLESYLRRHRGHFINKVQYGILVTNNRKAGESAAAAAYSNIAEITNDPDALSIIELLKWTYDISCGMEFLHQKKVIHGDLATRNILLSEDTVAKIGDFGLSRQLVECSNYVKKTQCPLPWRHLAPESLRDLEFSVKSDLWAFAVTMWEIYTLSEVPYPGVSFSSQFLLELEHGFRLNKPIYATNDLYEFMLKCWKINPEERPEFIEIQSLCENLLKVLVVENAVAPEYLELHESEEGN